MNEMSHDPNLDRLRASYQDQSRRYDPSYRGSPFRENSIQRGIETAAITVNVVEETDTHLELEIKDHRTGDKCRLYHLLKPRMGSWASSPEESPKTKNSLSLLLL